ncbi:hypothetical protein [Halapricum salinum]|uniref:Major facilitator superfamily (MFS) profile domain-containing protein n=1 Tax=Halapricum salinum TaxID=1457250 RepID=A0A4D6HFK1_9EURY|nr:hypothetical protein [Halapricum salinum]QCC51537.1 hypothetical protein DV733_09905 [Halapricum salinum]
MAENPIEQGLLTRTIFGLVIIFLISLGGGTVATVFLEWDVPYGAWIGVVVGGGLVLIAFVILYNRYDAQFESQ